MALPTFVKGKTGGFIALRHAHPHVHSHDLCGSRGIRHVPIAPDKINPEALCLRCWDLPVIPSPITQIIIYIHLHDGKSIIMTPIGIVPVKKGIPEVSVQLTHDLKYIYKICWDCDETTSDSDTDSD